MTILSKYQMLTTKFSHFNETFVNKFSISKLLIIGTTILLGLGMGLLISRSEWVFALFLSILIPIGILFIKRPFIGIIFWLFLMPYVYVLPNPDLVHWVIHRILVPVILLVLLIPHFLKAKESSSFHWGVPETAICLLAVYIPISLMYSSWDSLQTPFRDYIDRMLIPFCMYFIMRLINLDNWNYKLLQWAAFPIVLSQSIIGLMGWFSPALLPPVFLSYYKTRMSGSLLNPNVYAVVLGFCALILFQSAMRRRPGMIRTSFLLACGLSVLCIFLSMERAVWLGAVVVILGLVILYPKVMIHYLAIAVIVFVIIGTGFLSEKISEANSRITQQRQVDVRFLLVDAMLRMIEQKPVLGWGYDTLNQNIQQYYQPYGLVILGNRFETSHNTYLTIFTELGLVGFLLYTLPFCWLFIASIRIWREPAKIDPSRRSLLATFWLATILQFIVSNFMDMRFYPITLTLWWMGLGLIANLIDQKTEIVDDSATSLQARYILRNNQLSDLH